MADLGEGTDGPDSPLPPFWVKKEEMTEVKGEKRAEKVNTPPPSLDSPLPWP